MWIIAVNLSLFTAGQQVAKYNSIGATMTNFPSPLTYSQTGNSRPEGLGQEAEMPVISFLLFVGSIHLGEPF